MLWFDLVSFVTYVDVPDRPYSCPVLWGVIEANGYVSLWVVIAAVCLFDIREYFPDVIQGVIAYVFVCLWVWFIDPIYKGFEVLRRLSRGGGWSFGPGC